MPVFLLLNPVLIPLAIGLMLFIGFGAILIHLSSKQAKKQTTDFITSLSEQKVDSADTEESAPVEAEPMEEEDYEDYAEDSEDAEDNAEFPDPVFEEYAVTVKQMQCGVGLDKHHRYAFMVTFETNEGQSFVFHVQQSLYLSLSEGQKGYLATVNGNFFGFSPEGEEDSSGAESPAEASAEDTAAPITE